MRHLLKVLPACLICLLTGAPGMSDSPKADPKEKDKPPVVDPKDKPKMRLPSGHELMAAKLKASQAILEGLALEDYKKVGASADELVRVASVAEFLNAYKGREYELQMMLFKRAAEKVSAKAKEKNMDGVMLGYTDMTMTCLKCHQHVRDKGDALAPRQANPDSSVWVKK